MTPTATAADAADGAELEPLVASFGAQTQAVEYSPMKTYACMVRPTAAHLASQPGRPPSTSAEPTKLVAHPLESSSENAHRLADRFELVRLMGEQ